MAFLDLLNSLRPSGVVGLAVARRLAITFPRKSTFLVERNSSAGQETRWVESRSDPKTSTDLWCSARNSEVIHAGTRT